MQKCVLSCKISILFATYRGYHRMRLFSIPDRENCLIKAVLPKSTLSCCGLTRKYDFPADAKRRGRVRMGRLRKSLI